MQDEKTKANDRQVGGDHYQKGGLQHWDLFGPEYLVGCASKYVSRWRRKNGIEDLEKALHYAEKLREVCDAKPFTSVDFRTGDRESLRAWCRNSGLDFTETTVVFKLIRWKDKLDIDIAIEGIRHLIATAPTEKSSDIVGIIYKNGGPAELKGDARNKIYPSFREEMLTAGNGPMNEYHVSLGPSKTYRDMTDAELEAELRELQEKQAEAMRDEYIAEIGREKARRKRAAALRAERVNPERPVPRVTIETNKPIRTLDVEATEVINRQRTPEDGAQHASLVPWVVSAPWNIAGGIDNALFDKFWHRRTPGMYVLEPHADSHELPSALQMCYNLDVDGRGWTLRIDRCPPDAREYFPNLFREKNMMEWETLPKWQQELYLWNAIGNKYELEVAAWHAEEE